MVSWDCPFRQFVLVKQVDPVIWEEREKRTDQPHTELWEPLKSTWGCGCKDCGAII